MQVRVGSSKYLELPKAQFKMSKLSSAPINNSKRDLLDYLILDAGRNGPEEMNLERSSQQSTSGFSPAVLDRAGFDLKFSRSGSSGNKSMSLTDIDQHVPGIELDCCGV